MALRGRTPFFPFLGGSQSGLPILNASDLEHAFQKERSRVDRNGRGCSLVAFQIERPTSAGRNHLGDLLRKRSRLSDTLGQLHTHLLVALLPETSGEKGWCFADDIKDGADALGVKVHCEVYSYPRDWTNNNTGSDTFENAGEATQPLEHDLEPVVSRRKSPAPSPTTRRRQAAPEVPQVDVEEETTVLSVNDIGTEMPARPVGDLRPLIQHPLPFWKRALDIITSASLLIVLSPLLFIVGLAVKTTSNGPIIFRQKRVGEGGRPFYFYKFRSMYEDAEERKAELMEDNEADGPVFKIRNDPRFTAIGKLLRTSSIDELPQLWNVFKGDMTLVGPRPPTEDEVPNYELWQLHRLATRGGITCIWQVSGRSDIKFLEWARMDLRYLATKSFWTDLGLLWRTMSAVVSGKGAY
ncbi:MAG: lipopolysaccharide/colanic/teichoic acid biosynthesis glycosyltransferase [Chlamydiales bacterium]|jgi:lipopolysaccharide/colanic/teichoic acid biosynthesis glycosyltransferase